MNRTLSCFRKVCVSWRTRALHTRLCGCLSLWKICMTPACDYSPVVTQSLAKLLYTQPECLPTPVSLWHFQTHPPLPVCLLDDSSSSPRLPAAKNHLHVGEDFWKTSLCHRTQRCKAIIEGPSVSHRGTPLHLWTCQLPTSPKTLIPEK